MIKKKEKSGVIWGVTPEEEKFLKSSVEVRTSNSLTKSILNVLNGPDQTIERLAFEVDPSSVHSYAGIYKPKTRLLPDIVLKRIAIQDSLVSNIVRARQNQVSAFGRPRYERHDIGYIIKPNAGVTDGMNDEEKHELAAAIKRAVSLIGTCGHPENREGFSQKSFVDYLSLSSRDASVAGRIATEIVNETDLTTGEKTFHHFTHTDAGTIFQATVVMSSPSRLLETLLIIFFVGLLVIIN
jgi:hypothetical protein